MRKQRSGGEEICSPHQGVLQNEGITYVTLISVLSCFSVLLVESSRDPSEHFLEADAGDDFVPLPVLQDKLEVEDVPPGRYPRDIVDAAHDRKPLARLNIAWTKCLMTTCKRHPDCKLWIESKWLDESIHDCMKSLNVCYRWAAMGRVATRGQHMSEAERIRDALKGSSKK
eukprot:9469498-Pyramimonas_sp.AAC.2